MSSKLDVEKANIEFWEAKPLFKATGNFFGDIDHVIQAGSDYIVRAWLLKRGKTDATIKLGFKDTLVSPIIKDDLRDDVLEAFPSIRRSKNSGYVFIFENCVQEGEPPVFYWRVCRSGEADEDIPIEPKDVINADELFQV